MPKGKFQGKRISEGYNLKEKLRISRYVEEEMFKYIRYRRDVSNYKLSKSGKYTRPDKRKFKEVIIKKEGAIKCCVTERH